MCARVRAPKHMYASVPYHSCLTKIILYSWVVVAGGGLAEIKLKSCLKNHLGTGLPTKLFLLGHRYCPVLVKHHRRLMLTASALGRLW